MPTWPEFFGLRADQSLAESLRILKCNSTKWIHEKWKERCSLNGNADTSESR